MQWRSAEHRRPAARPGALERSGRYALRSALTAAWLGCRAVCAVCCPACRGCKSRQVFSSTATAILTVKEHLLAGGAQPLDGRLGPHRVGVFLVHGDGLLLLDEDDEGRTGHCTSSTFTHCTPIHLSVLHIKVAARHRDRRTGTSAVSVPALCSTRHCRVLANTFTGAGGKGEERRPPQSAFKDETTARRLRPFLLAGCVAARSHGSHESRGPGGTPTRTT